MKNREVTKSGALVFAGLIAFIVVVSLISVFAVEWNNWFSSTTAETRGKTAVRENTKANGDFRQSSYEGFFDLCSSAQTKQESIANLDDELKAGVSDARKDQILASKTALRNSLSEVVNQYNTKANEFTRAQFLDSKLPYPLNAKDTIQCV